MALTDAVTTLKGVGKTRAKQLRKLGIETIQDLISYYPRQYEDRSRISAVSDLQVGIPTCFEAVVVSAPRVSYIRQGLNTTRCTVADSSASVNLAWFNQPWMRDNLIPGKTYCFYGTLTGDAKKMQVLNPVAEDPKIPPKVTRCIIPVYPLTKGLTSKVLQQLIFQALEREELPDDLPETVRAGLMPLRPAYEEVHCPTNPENLAQARRRLVFEEFFLYALGLEKLRTERSAESAFPCRQPIPQAFYDNLPYALTDAQRRALDEILGDLSSGRTMNRLLQGDVGSGKTIVALGAMLHATVNGLQAALMAPTELLASQHYRTISSILEPLGVRCVLLTGSIPTKERRRIMDALMTGAVPIVVGTHSLFTSDVVFSNLGIVVIDEQHRFGVSQRAALAAKGNAPHVLVLSATPIPRTLALILYGDLDISVINELPPGRKPVKTYLVERSYHARLLGFIRKQIAEGHQVYVVCPAVEDSSDMASVETTFSELQAAFPDCQVGLVHGKLRPEARDLAMAAFLHHETDILVATTVIEVGVDVKNATLMIVMDADRFGLSQLHQLRGRVGRNETQSYCVLVSDNTGPDTRRRLQALCKTNDGFAISQADLEQRGPGDFFGNRQSGLPMFQSASLANDIDVLREAQKAASDFLAYRPDPALPEYAGLFQRVEKLFSESNQNLQL